MSLAKIVIHINHISVFVSPLLFTDSIRVFKNKAKAISKLLAVRVFDFRYFLLSWANASTIVWCSLSKLSTINYVFIPNGFLEFQQWCFAVSFCQIYFVRSFWNPSWKLKVLWWIETAQPENQQNRTWL